LAETLGLFVAALLAGVLLLRVLLRWRHALAVGRARRIAERLRLPATTLAAVEDQSAAVEELCRFRDTQAAVAAARELLDERDETIRSAAIEILRRARALDLWVRDLRVGCFRAKVNAIQALGEVGDERAVDELIEALGDDDPDVARAASHAVVARDPEFACERLAEALSSPNRRIAETAAATLVRLGAEAEECLVGQLAGLSAQARRLAVECLATVANSLPLTLLLPLLDTDPAPEVRVAVAEAVARMGGEEAWSRLRLAFHSDPDWFVRTRAASLLAEANAPGAAEFLMGALSDLQDDLTWRTADGEDVEAVAEGTQRIRSAIISGLRLLGAGEDQIAAAARPRAEERTPIEDVTPAEDEAESQAAAVRGLVARDPAQRVGAVRQLTEAGRKASSLLRGALRDPDPLVRAEAARALGRVGAGDCLGALADCLEDPDADVRLAASNAMRAIVMREAPRELPAAEPGSEAD
jgi:HEAT repeat protein